MDLGVFYMISVLKKAGVPFKIEETATKNGALDECESGEKNEKSSEKRLTKRKSVL